eukprot:1074993-Amphidinium_carterae.1
MCNGPSWVYRSCFHSASTHRQMKVGLQAILRSFKGASDDVGLRVAPSAVYERATSTRVSATALLMVSASAVRRSGRRCTEASAA